MTLLLGLTTSLLLWAPQQPPAHFVGAVVLPGGAPYQSQSVLVHAFKANGTSRSLQRVPTDELGRFGFDLVDRSESVAALFIKTIDVKHGAWIVVGAPPGKTRDLGTISLQGARRFLSGTLKGFREIPEDWSVEDLSRLPEREVTLWPEIRFPGADNGQWRWINGGSQVDRTPLREGGYEARATMLRLTCRKDGAFEAFGWPPPGPMRLHAQSRYHLPRDPIAFDPGDEVEVIVQKGATLRARVHLGKLLPRNEDERPRRRRRHREPPPEHAWVVPRLVPLNDPAGATLIARDGEAGDSLTDRSLPREGRVPDVVTEGTVEYEWPSMPSGSYRLEVSLWGSDEPAIVVGEIELKSPFLYSDDKGRLKKLDLTSHVQVRELRVLGVGGAPLPRADGAVLLGAPTPSGRRSYPLAKGVARLLSGPSALAVEVRVPGYRPQAVALDNARRSVTLTPGPAIEIVLARSQKLPKDALLEAELVPLDPGTRIRQAPSLGADIAPPEMGIVPMGDFPTARGTVSAPGRWLVRLRIQDERYKDFLLVEGATAEFEVSDTGPNQVTVPLPEASVREVLGRLRIE